MPSAKFPSITKALGFQQGFQQGPDYQKNIKDAANSISSAFQDNDNSPQQPDQTGNQLPAYNEQAIRQKVLGATPRDPQADAQSQNIQQEQAARSNVQADQLHDMMDQTFGNAPDPDQDKLKQAHQDALKQLMQKNNGYDY